MSNPAKTSKIFFFNCIFIHIHIFCRTLIKKCTCGTPPSHSHLIVFPTLQHSCQGANSGCWWFFYETCEPKDISNNKLCPRVQSRDTEWTLKLLAKDKWKFSKIRIQLGAPSYVNWRSLILILSRCVTLLK